MKNIVLIHHEPLTKRIKRIFCIDEIIKAGFDFEYWDISQICNHGINLPAQIEVDYIKHIYQLSNFKDEINKLNRNDAIFIVEMFFSYENRKIWRELRKTEIKIVKFERYGNTTLPSSNSLINIVKKIFSKDIFAKVYKKIIFYLYRKIFNLKKYNYLVTSATSPCSCKVNHPDYDLYLEHKNDEPIINYKYIVFVDTGFGKHPDELFFKGQKKINDNILWQSKLCNFFDYVEKKYNLPIVIAVHPKILYEDNEFGGRKKIKNETLNLISNAEFVLQDQSNSISFSIINNKKVGFIVTNEFYETYGRYMNSLMAVLNTTVFNIDTGNFSDFNFSSFTDEVRKNYMYDYLTDKTIKDKKTEQIFIDFLRTV